MKKFEKNVPNDKVFHLSNGQVINNIKELYDMINHMPEDVFFHHVNDQRNDFSNWVRDVMGEKTLAQSIAKAGTPVMLKDVLAGAFSVKTPAAKKTTVKKAVAEKKVVEKKPVAKAQAKAATKTASKTMKATKSSKTKKA